MVLFWNLLWNFLYRGLATWYIKIPYINTSKKGKTIYINKPRDNAPNSFQCNLLLFLFLLLISVSFASAFFVIVTGALNISCNCVIVTTLLSLCYCHCVTVYILWICRLNRIRYKKLMKKWNLIEFWIYMIYGIGM